MIEFSLLFQLAITIDPVTTLEIIEISTALVELVSEVILAYYSIKQVRPDK
jgi:hypothetical protein